MSSSRHGNLLEPAKWAVQHVKNKITDHPLELAATATGGEHIGTLKNHSQYSLSYIPSGTNQTGYHESKVEVKKSGLKVRARPGCCIVGPES